MSAAPILLSLVALCLGIFLWLWLCAQFGAGGMRGRLGRIAVQLSGLCLIYGILRGQPMQGVFMAVFPPLAVPELLQLGRFSLFLSGLIWPVLACAGGMLAIALAVRPLRDWAVGLTLVVALVAGVVVGERVSQTAMCEAAAAKGFAAFDRNSLITSLAAAPRAFQFDLHARADQDGDAWGWSYRDMDWYVIPAAARPNVSGGQAFARP